MSLPTDLYVIFERSTCRSIMYLLTEWEGRTGKYLARGHGRTERAQRGPYRMTKSQIFFRPARPNSVNKHFIIWQNSYFLFQTATKQVRTPFWAGRTAFYCPLTKTRTAPITWLFCMVFIRAARAGKYGHVINNSIHMLEGGFYD